MNTKPAKAKMDSYLPLGVEIEAVPTRKSGLRGALRSPPEPDPSGFFGCLPAARVHQCGGGARKRAANRAPSSATEPLSPKTHGKRRLHWLGRGSVPILTGVAR